MGEDMRETAVLQRLKQGYTTGARTLASRSMKYPSAAPAAAHVDRRVRIGMPARSVDQMKGAAWASRPYGSVSRAPKAGGSPCVSKNRAKGEPGQYQSSRESSFQLPVPATKIGLTDGAAFEMFSASPGTDAPRSNATRGAGLQRR